MNLYTKSMESSSVTIIVLGNEFVDRYDESRIHNENY
ncbi:hypothetical protein SDC9_92525 [bioreactor metagenome]|uniref:Uncharacterized protein n=1 Tax=bioreactor metagenome TaxID=1076179 RepID=A0A645A4R3_9ZZZZ